MTVLVVGSGYLAGHIGARLRADGQRPVLCSRRRPGAAPADGLPWRGLDVRDASACRDLVRELAPDALVVVHGPSDITWCEGNPEQAMAVHGGGAGNLAAAGGRLPTLLISTDNVFAGSEPSYAESDATSPSNAYGLAKLRAEELLLAGGATLVLRVSLVYGWDPDGHRPNFFTVCVRRLLAGEPVSVPTDHWNTPVLVDDVADWSTALLGAGRTGVLHLAGPQRLSRYEWAKRIAEQLGLDTGLVRQVPKAETSYACRPVNACLHSERAERLPELARLRPLNVDEGARRSAGMAELDVPVMRPGSLGPAREPMEDR